MVELSRKTVARLRSLLRGPDAAPQRDESGSDSARYENAAAILDDLCPKMSPDEWPEDAMGSW